jgi:hypothetical protein
VPTITANVTAALIAHRGRDCLSCPVALAVAAALPAGREVCVFADRIYIGRRAYPTPDRVRAFIVRYDLWPHVVRHPDLSAFSFELDVEERALEPVRVTEEAA